MDVITREQAKDLGLDKFFTGIPCKNGHISERYMNSRGSCIECERLKRDTKYEKWVRECKQSKYHINRDYDYEPARLHFINSSTPVPIWCNRHKVFFNQTPKSHKTGRGCAKCGNEQSRGPNYSTEEWIKKAKKIHWDYKLNQSIYTYHNTIYNGSHNILKIECREHGEFEQRAYSHLNGNNGCPECTKKLLRLPRIANGKDHDEKTEWLLRIPDWLKEKNTYDKVDFKSMSHKVVVTCKKPAHGDFLVTPKNHSLNTSGCPKCSHNTSKAEEEIRMYIKSLGFTANPNKCDIIKPRYIDILVETQKLAIEYHGIHWHSEIFGKKNRNYHLEKLEACNAAGYKLISIFENEWIQKREIVKSRLRYILGKHQRGYGARLLQIKNIDFPTSRDFLNLYHLQGYTSQMPWRYGAYHNDELVAVMTFCRPRVNMGRRNGYPELVRFATDGRNHAGVGSRLFSTYIKEHKPDGIISYSDRRWSDGGFYKTIGFNHISTSAPNYYYHRGYGTSKLENRFKFQKAKLVKKYGADPSKTEWEIMQNMGYDRIWDCGTDKWEWTIQK